MSDLFRKLNVLLKARINDVLGENLPNRPVDKRKLGKNLQSEVEMLRVRINDAIAYEENLQAKVDSIRLEAEQLDQQADNAVQQGNDAQARHLIGQLQRTQQRLAMAESDLHEHQLVTQDLIHRVNMLDAVVAEVNNRQLNEANDNPQNDVQQISDESEGNLANTIRQVRESVGNIGENITSPVSKVNTETKSLEDAPSADDERAVNDDLDSRRQRLSKPK